MRYCFKEKGTIALIIRNTSEDISFVRNLLFSASIPVYLFETKGGPVLSKNRRFRPIYKLNETVIRRPNYPNSFVIIETSNINIFTTVLEDIRNSIWWNHAAHYLIVNRISECDSQTAAVFLSILWSYNILSGLYLCANKKNKSIYTFNPYSNLAPKFWTSIPIGQFVNEHWTLFEHPLESTFKILNNSGEYYKYRYIKLSLLTY